QRLGRQAAGPPFPRPPQLGGFAAQDVGRRLGGEDRPLPLAVVEGGQEVGGDVLLRGQGPGDRPPALVREGGRVGAEEVRRGRNAGVGHRDVERHVVALEPPAPGAVAGVAEQRGPVVAGVAAPAPALAFVEHVLQPADRRHPGVGGTGDGGDQDAVYGLGRFPSHLRQRHAAAPAGRVVPLRAAGVVEREAQRRLLFGGQRGEQPAGGPTHRLGRGGARNGANRGHGLFIPAGAAVRLVV